MYVCSVTPRRWSLWRHMWLHSVMTTMILRNPRKQVALREKSRLGNNGWDPKFLSTHCRWVVLMVGTTWWFIQLVKGEKHQVEMDEEDYIFRNFQLQLVSCLRPYCDESEFIVPSSHYLPFSTVTLRPSNLPSSLVVIYILHRGSAKRMHGLGAWTHCRASLAPDGGHYSQSNQKRQNERWIGSRMKGKKQKQQRLACVWEAGGGGGGVAHPTTGWPTNTHPTAGDFHHTPPPSVCPPLLLLTCSHALIFSQVFQIRTLQMAHSLGNRGGQPPSLNFCIFNPEEREKGHLCSLLSACEEKSKDWRHWRKPLSFFSAKIMKVNAAGEISKVLLSTLSIFVMESLACCHCRGIHIETNLIWLLE